MAGEQLQFAFPPDGEPANDPVTPEVYQGIVRARSIAEVRAAFRMYRLAASARTQSVEAGESGSKVA